MEKDQNKPTVAVAAEPTQQQPVERSTFQSFFSFDFFFKTILLYWQWFVISLFLCVGVALIYIRYTPPVFSVKAKILIKEDNSSQRSGRNAIAATNTLGLMTNTDGFENELEVIKSVTVAEGVVNDLKLYVDYETEGRVTELAAYKNVPVSADMDSTSLHKLAGSVVLQITRDGNNFKIEGTYDKGGKITFERSGSLPMTISLPVGRITLTPHPEYLIGWKGDRYLQATISNPKAKAGQYAGMTSVAPLTKTTTIADVSMLDIIPQRAQDYLRDLAVVYNRQANEDKNQMAVRTEYFINDRLAKLNVELGSTDGSIQSYKQQNKLIDATANGALNLSNSDATQKSIIEMGTQILLMESVKEFMLQPGNKYKLLPSNVGIQDEAATDLIGSYNEVVIERNRLLQTASELSPKVQELTNVLNDYMASIRKALDQASKNKKIQLQELQSQYTQYSGLMSQTPQQERILTQIGRLQTVKEGLYVMLLQKREENSINLAATADKGKLIDEPETGGKVKPQPLYIMGGAIAIGLGLPFLILVLIEFFRFRIEGHSDVETLTPLPIIADIAVASDNGKGKADIVVHENKNNQMEEIFRSMRTNIQFMLQEDQNVVMLTSSTSGEGKTFVAANLAVSFALLGKKVLLVGLDIRRPRLTNLFELKDTKKGISMLLTKEHPTLEEIKENIQPSGVNKHLDILTAGPVPPNPTEILSRQSLEDIFSIIKKEYDYVICDTAPIGLVTDTVQIARVVDATVLVCRADYTEKSAFALVNDLAETGKLPNVAIAINGIDMTRKKYGYAYGYGKYGKYKKYGKRYSGYKSYGSYGNTGRYGGYGNYGSYGGYGGYGRYGSYGSYGYGRYGSYGSYGYGSYGYGSYSSSKYGNPEDDSIKK